HRLRLRGEGRVEFLKPAIARVAHPDHPVGCDGNRLGPGELAYRGASRPRVVDIRPGCVELFDSLVEAVHGIGCAVRCHGDTKCLRESRRRGWATVDLADG